MYKFIKKNKQKIYFLEVPLLISKLMKLFDIFIKQKKIRLQRFCQGGKNL